MGGLDKEVKAVESEDEPLNPSPYLRCMEGGTRTARECEGLEGDPDLNEHDRKRMDI